MIRLVDGDGLVMGLVDEEGLVMGLVNRRKVGGVTSG